MFGLLIALLSGACMSVQGVFNTQLTKSSSLWVAAAWVQLTALGICILAWGISGRESISALLEVQPKYMLLGGVIGAVITITVVKSMALLGPAKASMLIVISQIGVAYGIELLGMFGVEKVEFSLRKFLGFLLAVVGIYIFG